MWPRNGTSSASDTRNVNDSLDAFAIFVSSCWVAGLAKVGLHLRRTEDFSRLTFG
jgi:hypothetical protein